MTRGQPVIEMIYSRDHKDRGGLETGNLRKQFKNYEKFAVIFQIRKQQETMQHEALKRCFPRTVLGRIEAEIPNKCVFFQKKFKKKSKKYFKKFNFLKCFFEKFKKIMYER